MNKIKTRIFNHYIISLIEKNSLDEINIQKLPTEFNAQLKKEVNQDRQNFVGKKRSKSYKNIKLNFERNSNNIQKKIE